MENNKKLNSHALYSNNRSFFPIHIFSPNQKADKPFATNFISKNQENNKSISLKINNSLNNLFDIDEYYHQYLIEKNNFKGGKISSKNYFKYLQRTLSKQSNYQNMKSFFDKSNKLNKLKCDSINGIPNLKLIKSKKKDSHLNLSCPLINNVILKNTDLDKYNENAEKMHKLEKIDKIKKYEDFNGIHEIEKNFINNSDIYKIEYIKKIIRKHYFENFENLKDYFMSMSGKDKYINIDDIIFYLKEIIKVSIDKKEIRQLLYSNGIIKVDFNNFKFIFFPEMKNHKLINLRLKNEKCNILKKETNANIVNNKNTNNNKSMSQNNENFKSLNVRNESKKRQRTNKSSRENVRVFPNQEIKRKLKNREINSKMKFFMIDVNKDYIIKRFNEKYENSENKLFKVKKLLNFKAINGENKNKKFEGFKNLKKIVNLKINDNNKINMKTSKSYNNLNKNNLKLFILKMNNLKMNKIDEKLKTSSTNTSNCKDIKYFKIEDNSNFNKFKLNSINLNYKNYNSNRLLRNDMKSSDFSKIVDYSTSNVNKLTSFYINNSKEKNETKTKDNKKKEKPIRKNNEILNQDSNANKTFLFFRNDVEDIKQKEYSFCNNRTQNEREIKINKNSDILDFL